MGNLSAPSKLKRQILLITLTILIGYTPLTSPYNGTNDPFGAFSNPAELLDNRFDPKQFWPVYYNITAACPPSSPGNASYASTCASLINKYCSSSNTSTCTGFAQFYSSNLVQTCTPCILGISDSVTAEWGMDILTSFIGVDGTGTSILTTGCGQQNSYLNLALTMQANAFQELINSVCYVQALSNLSTVASNMQNVTQGVSLSLIEYVSGLQLPCMTTAVAEIVNNHANSNATTQTPTAGYPCLDPSNSATGSYQPSPTIKNADAAVLAGLNANNPCCAGQSGVCPWFQGTIPLPAGSTLSNACSSALPPELNQAQAQFNVQQFIHDQLSPETPICAIGQTYPFNLLAQPQLPPLCAAGVTSNCRCTYLPDRTGITSANIPPAPIFETTVLQYDNTHAMPDGVCTPLIIGRKLTNGITFDQIKTAFQLLNSKLSTQIMGDNKCYADQLPPNCTPNASTWTPGATGSCNCNPACYLLPPGTSITDNNNVAATSVITLPGIQSAAQRGQQEYANWIATAEIDATVESMLITTLVTIVACMAIGPIVGALGGETFAAWAATGLGKLILNGIFMSMIYIPEVFQQNDLNTMLANVLDNPLKLLNSLGNSLTTLTTNLANNIQNSVCETLGCNTGSLSTCVNTAACSACPDCCALCQTTPTAAPGAATCCNTSYCAQCSQCAGFNYNQCGT